MSAILSDVGITPDTDDILGRAPCRIGRVSLVVRDKARVGRFYRDVIGLSTVAETAQVLHLGVGEDVLLTLRHQPEAPPPAAGEAGLYHTAFLLPSRTDLGAWLIHALQRRAEISGATDHGVSEAVYLSDPEGNGIEIYADRPGAKWPRKGDRVELSGMARLDLQALMRDAEHAWTGMPSGSRVGHVHLRVGNLRSADMFYGTLLGFHTEDLLPVAHFYSSGGYHHQLAANTFEGAGAGPRAPGRTGLAEVQVLVKEKAMMADIHQRLTSHGYASLENEGGDILVSDPWKTVFRLTNAPPSASNIQTG